MPSCRKSGAVARGDDDLAPADPLANADVRECEPTARRRRPEDGIEAHRLQAACSRALGRRCATTVSGTRLPSTVSSSLCASAGGIAGLPHRRALLKRRDLGQVERVAHEDRVACEIDRREVVDREVAERVGGRAPGVSNAPTVATKAGEEEQQALHETDFRASGAKRTEKFGFKPSAFAYQAFIPALSPAHPAA